MTLDGKIAPPPRAESKSAVGIPAGGWITGEAARAHVHEQRHQSDAIMVGVGTILADDPLLTDRSGHPRRRPLLRVILDSHLRLPLESRLVQSVANEGSFNSDVLIFCSSGVEEEERTGSAWRSSRTISSCHGWTPGYSFDLAPPRTTGTHQRDDRRWSDCKRDGASLRHR